MIRPKPVVLAILDGWGHRDAHEDNAIAAANTPCWNALMRDYPHGLLNASEHDVGLPKGQMGNSEVGHMNIGSGRVIMQDLPRIDAAIADGSLAKHPALAKLKGTVHLLGLLSDGGVHSHQSHLVALAKMLAGQGAKVYVHAFLDGRDTPPQSALEYIRWWSDEVMEWWEENKHNTPSPHHPITPPQIATVSGRYYAMDRDKRWDRVQKAYDTLTQASGENYKTAREAIEKSYAANVNDEFVLPCTIGDYSGMQDGDAIVCGNFRADRVREILTTLLDPNFKDFPRAKEIKFSGAIGLAEYSKALAPFMTTLFAPQPLTKILGEVVADAGLKQLRIAETEKYAHVTFFFNGGREKEFAGESRILVPSPKVATYDLKPEMSAPEVTDKLVEAINADRFDFIVVNYANADMVGHTGDIVAAKKAVEAVDACLTRVSQAVLAKGGAMLITADHGNAEMMHDHETHQAHTAHTLNLVPVVLVSNDLKGKTITIKEGRLADVAPTILSFLKLPQPVEMTGRALV